jgi:short subunit dehydrogenase-like uncharacterized protein
MADTKRWMIYGAYGYTGRLVVAEARRKGLTPILAGRDRQRVEDAASRAGLEARAFSLDEDFHHALSDVEAVLHCAGPFTRTSEAMVDACIRTTTQYLDVTGEIEVFERIFRRSGEARDAGVCLIPGVGFDVVPTDCLAAILSEKVPDATHLDLAFSSRRGGISRGTLKTMIEGLGRGGAVRKEGTITPVPVAWDVREIPYESGPRLSMTIPWGDVSTAYHTTGIPNIRVYTGTSKRAVRRLKRVRPFLPLARLVPVKWLLLRLADRQQGPDAGQRARSHIELWGEAWSQDSGTRRSITMRIPEGYSFTAAASVLAVERVLSGDVSPGSWTPAQAFGSGFVHQVLETFGKPSEE